MKSARTHRSRQLRSQLAKAKADVTTLESRMTALGADLKAKRITVAKLEAELSKLDHSAAPRVSDHAVVRYIERVEGVDIVAIRKAILHPKIMEMVATLGGSGSFPHPDGYVIKMADGVVVTVTVSGEEP
jgi:hypothetical protein